MFPKNSQYIVYKGIKLFNRNHIIKGTFVLPGAGLVSTLHHRLHTTITTAPYIAGI